MLSKLEWTRKAKNQCRDSRHVMLQCKQPQDEARETLCLLLQLLGLPVRVVLPRCAVAMTCEADGSNDFDPQLDHSYL